LPVGGLPPSPGGGDMWTSMTGRNDSIAGKHQWRRQRGIQSEQVLSLPPQRRTRLYGGRKETN